MMQFFEALRDKAWQCGKAHLTVQSKNYFKLNRKVTKAIGENKDMQPLQSLFEEVVVRQAYKIQNNPSCSIFRT